MKKQAWEKFKQSFQFDLLNIQLEINEDSIHELFCANESVFIEVRVAIVRLWHSIQPPAYISSNTAPKEWSDSKYHVPLDSIFNKYELWQALFKTFYSIPYIPTKDMADFITINADGSETDDRSLDDKIICWQGASSYKKYAWLSVNFAYFKVVKTNKIYTSGNRLKEFSTPMEAIPGCEHLYAAWRLQDLFLALKPLPTDSQQALNLYNSGERVHPILPSDHQIADWIEAHSGVSSAIYKNRINMLFRALSLVIEAWVYQTNPHLSYNKLLIASELKKSPWLKSFN